MADITVTAANVAAGTGSVLVDGTFGEAVTAGQAVYLKSADSEWYLAQADSASEDDVVGIAMNGGADGQPGKIQTRGQITIGGTVAVGTIYVLSATAAGGIAPSTDLTSTDYVTVIGIGMTTAVIDMHLKTSSIQVPA